MDEQPDESLDAAIDAEIDAAIGDSGFSGVVRIDLGGRTVRESAHGLADRAHEVPCTVDTRVATASGSKGLTALMVMRLVEDGLLSLDTTARSLLGGDLPLVADDVTVEHLLAHRSGIGDYLDEDEMDDIGDHVLTVPVHTLATTAGFLPMLDGLPTVFPADSRFAYCNGGFVLLALLAERATGRGFHDLVDELVIGPAGMTRTAYLRNDELPADAAIGYLAPDGLRSNVLHMPVRGNGDGGLYTTVADVHTMWEALFAGDVVAESTLVEMVRPRSEAPEGDRRYGLGFWLHGTTDAVILDGYDAGASFRSAHWPSRSITYTVMSNTSDGAWPVNRVIARSLLEP
jgi:CubicO group peptidase (beta-lactamase class C family)